MISSNFGFGEQSKIASAYAQMYAPKSKMEESCNKGGCEKKTAKKPVKEACGNGGLVKKHVEPKKTGSKLGVRKMLPFDKRDAKSSAKKFTPPVKKSAKNESVAQMTGYCITDGDKTLCTNDVNESYFSKEGITGETRIYESAVSALKDIKKVSARRNPNKKYCIRKCQCVGESFEFVPNSNIVNEAWWNPLDAVGGAVKGLGNLAGAAGNALTGDFSAAGKNLGDAWDNAKQTVAPVTGLVGAGVDAAKAGADAVAKSATEEGGVLNTIGNGIADGAKAVGGAVVDGAKNVGQGALNTVGGTLNTGANLLGAAGNALTGDFGAAKDNLGAMVDSGKQALGGVVQAASPALNVAGGALKGVGAAANAAGNLISPSDNKEAQQPQQPQQQAAQAQQQQQQKPQQPLTQAQKVASANGAGPVTDAAAQNNPAVKAQQQQQKTDAATAAANSANALAPDSVKNYMADSQKKDGKSQQQAAATNGQHPSQQQDNAGKKAELQKQIEALQKQLQELG